MKKRLALLAALVMSSIMVLGAVPAMALTEMPSANISITAGSTDSLSVESDYGSITGVSSSSPTVATVTYSGSSFTITGVTAGSSTITVYSKNSSTGVEYYGYVYVTVTAAATTTSTNGETVEVGKQIVKSFYAIGTATSNNPSVATVSYTSMSSDSTFLTVNGVSVGTATITYTYKASSSASSYTTATLTVNVVAAGTTTTTTTTTSTTANMTVKVGKSFKLKNGYYNVTNVASSNTAIATAEATGEVGSMNIKVAGVAAGTCDITFNYQTGSTSTSFTAKIALTVTDGEVVSANSPTMKVGLYLGASSYSVQVDTDNYRRASNILLNGVSIEPEELRWMSTKPSVVKINEDDGKFWAIKAGTARIIAVTPDAQYIASFTVTVTE